jgi:uncharacterized protein with FMN-binding domain
VKRAVPIMILTVAGLIPLWRFEPTPETTTSSAESTQAPSTSTAAGSEVVAGSTVTTRYGTVQVEVTFSGTEIASVRMLQQPDSGPTSKAVPELVQETLTAQSADVDTVSGATTTSEAYVDSLQAAIDGRDR